MYSFVKRLSQLPVPALLLAMMFTLLLIISLLAWRNFPNGLFSVKEIGFYTVGGVCGIIGAWYNWRYRLTYRLRLIDGLVLAYLIAVPYLQYVLHNEVHWYSIAEHLGLAMIYIIVSTMCSTMVYKTVISSLCLSSSVIFLISLAISVSQYVGFQYAHHHVSRISGMFFNPGPYAIFLASLMMIITVAVTINYRKRNPMLAKVLMVLLGIGVLVLAELDSRSAWIGLSAGGIVLILAYSKTYFHWIILRYGKRLVVFGVLILIFIACLAAGFYHMRPDSVKGRVLVWRSTWKMIKEHPIDGVGIDRFSAEYPAYQGKTLLSDNLKDRYGNLAGESIYAFNDILHITAERGVIGGLLFIGVISFSIVRLYKMVRYHSDDAFIYGTGLAASLVVIVIAGMTAYPLQMLPINIWFWTLIALTNVNLGAASSKKKIKAYGTVTTTIFLVCITIVLLFTGIKRTIAYVRWYKIEQGEATEKAVLAIAADLKGNGKFYNQIGHYYRVHENFDIALDYFRQAALYDFDKEYYYDLGSCYEQLERFEDAMNCYLLIEKAIPHLIKPKYLIAKLYFRQEDMKSFRSKAREVLELIPKVRNTDHEMIKRELRFLLVNLENDQ